MKRFDLGGKGAIGPRTRPRSRNWPGWAWRRPPSRSISPGRWTVRRWWRRPGIASAGSTSLIDNAGTTRRTQLEGTGFHETRSSAWLCPQAAYPEMKAAGSGMIVMTPPTGTRCRTSLRPARSARRSTKPGKSGPPGSRTTPIEWAILPECSASRHDRDKTA